MESEQFASLGDRITLDAYNENHPNTQLENQSEVDITRRHSFILFDEIIEPSPTQSRTVVFDPEKFEQDKVLLESIRSNGIVTHITVRELEQDGQVNDPFLQKKQGKRTFALVAGHRRVAAGIAAGLHGAQGMITKPSDDHALLTLVENSGRRELTTYENALSLKSFQERRELSNNKTAKLTGYSLATVNRQLSALKSPHILLNFWKEGRISDTSIEILKKHWQTFELIEDTTLPDQILKITRSDAESLRDQLGSGTPFKIAIKSLLGTREHTATKGTTVSRATTTEQSNPVADPEPQPVEMRKSDLLRAIKDIFPKINEAKGAAIYDYGIVNGTTDPDMIWAAALYVAQGGKLDQAMDLAIKLMSSRKTAGLINRQVKQAKQAASIYKNARKNKKEIRNYIRTVFL
jgi:ParB/RepB/Spo0J family partition protein